MKTIAIILALVVGSACGAPEETPPPDVESPPAEAPCGNRAEMTDALRDAMRTVALYEKATAAGEPTDISAEERDFAHEQAVELNAELYRCTQHMRDGVQELR